MLNINFKELQNTKENLCGVKHTVQNNLKGHQLNLYQMNYKALACMASLSDIIQTGDLFYSGKRDLFLEKNK